MRTVRIIVVVLVLIGFPLASWLYLSSGLKWRLDAQEETARKDSLVHFALRGSDGSMLTPEVLRGRYYVIASPADDREREQLRLVQEQFGKRADFQTILLVPDNMTGLQDTAGRWMTLRCTEGCPGLRGALFADGTNAAIVDDQMWVRGRYTLAQEEGLRSLIKHLAVVLPIEKREKLELRRSGDKN